MLKLLTIGWKDLIVTFRDRAALIMMLAAPFVLTLGMGAVTGAFSDGSNNGIDPQSRRRILDMVLELRDQGMTVLYTTHYMEEAEELSDRVGIMDHGKLIALGTQKELTRLVGQQETLRLHFGEGQLMNGEAALFEGVDGVLQVTTLADELVLGVTETTAVLPDVVAIANAHNLRIRSVDIAEPNLEAVFLHLTGRALRD